MFKKLSRCRLHIVFFSVIFAIMSLFYLNKDIIKDDIYLYPYKDIIIKYAKQNELEVSLLAAVILSESKFYYSAESHRGAKGLMQLMPETARWVAGEIGLNNYAEDQLLEPEINIMLGSWYLASLKREFNNNEVLMLAAYNAGRGNVNDWMKQYDWHGDFANIEEIPFPETKNYVEKVLMRKKVYEDLCVYKKRMLNLQVNN